MSDVHPAMKVLYCPQWYEQDVMRLIIGTFEDYCEDLKSHMPEYVFGKLVSEMMEQFQVFYVESFVNKNAKYKTSGCIDRLKADAEKVKTFFSKHKSEKRVTSAFDVIDKIIALIEANPRMLYFDFYSMWKQYPDIPMEYLERLLLKREDMDKQATKEMIELCKSKTSEEKPEETQPTVFSKINKLI
jgi:hypothetical protein